MYSEILATTELDKAWTDFENAATYEYARDFVEEKYRSNTKVHTSSSVSIFDFELGSSEDIHRPVKQTETSVSLQTQVDALKDRMVQMQKNFEIQTQAKQVDALAERMTQIQRNVIEMQAHTKQVGSNNTFIRFLNMSH